MIDPSIDVGLFLLMTWMSRRAAAGEGGTDRELRGAGGAGDDPGAPLRQVLSRQAHLEVPAAETPAQQGEGAPATNWHA